MYRLYMATALAGRSPHPRTITRQLAASCCTPAVVVHELYIISSWDWEASGRAAFRVTALLVSRRCSCCHGCKFALQALQFLKTLALRCLLHPLLSRCPPYLHHGCRPPPSPIPAHSPVLLHHCFHLLIVSLNYILL